MGSTQKAGNEMKAFSLLPNVPRFCVSVPSPFHFGVLLQGLLWLSQDMQDLIDTLLFIPCPRGRIWFSSDPGTGQLSSSWSKQGQQLASSCPPCWFFLLPHLA